MPVRRYDDRRKRRRPPMQVRDHAYLEARRKFKNVSISELARYAGYTDHSYMSKLLSGKERSVRPRPARLIAERLDNPVEELFVPSRVKSFDPTRNAA